VKTRVKQLLRAVLGPALRWLSAQLGELQRGLDGLRSGQDRLLEQQGELTAANRAVIAQRELEIEVVGRTLSVQRDSLEALEAEQRRLGDEVRSLRAVIESLRDEAGRVAEPSDAASS
jgi:prefoldin subunit 5